MIPKPKNLVSIGDAELVARAIEGDAWAKEALFKRHVRSVSGMVMRMIGDRVDAEDIVQDTFTAAFSALDQLRDPGALRGWLLQIAVRRVYRRLQRKRLLALLGFETDPTKLASMADPGASPEVKAELALLDRVLCRLRAEERIAWMLRYVEGQSLEEIAEVLDVSLATVKRRIKKAHARVSRHMLKGGAP